jgi:hypothetical protein
MDFPNLLASVELYGRAAEMLNEFFDRWTAYSCSRCFDLCVESYPDDPFSSFELAEGVFPGCCQAGVAEDFRVIGLGEPLPSPLVETIRHERSVYLASLGISYPSSNAPEDFVLIHRNNAERKTGVGCKWLSSKGCTMGRWKSPICMAFMCEPVRQGLSHSAAGDRWPLESDFCGISKVFSAIGTASVGGRALLDRAVDEVESLEELLRKRSAMLEEFSGLSQ